MTTRVSPALQSCRHWVFDMDGTLTVAVHDFPAIKRALGIPQDDDTLFTKYACPVTVASANSLSSVTLVSLFTDIIT